MTERPLTSATEKRFNLTSIVFLILPIVLLAIVILVFLETDGGLDLTAPAPVEDLTIERTVLQPGQIEVYIRNGGPESVTLAQVSINEALWPFTISPESRIGRLQEARLQIAYPWSYGEAYTIRLFTTNAIAFDVEIPVAFETPGGDSRTFLSFTLIGLYVGVIPVFLGLFWYPVLRQLGQEWMIFLLAITAGLLVFLGLDTLVEALEQAGSVPGPFQGVGLVGIGVVGTFFLLEAISKRQASIGRNEAAKRLSLAYMIAVGIGLHNLGEGLAIGAAYNVGEVALGTFLVVGFIIQNITEGLGIIAPVLRDRPAWIHLFWMGLVGGAPAITGAWLGAFSPSPTLAVLFLSVGSGAVFEVVYEIGKMIQKDSLRQSKPLTVFSGILTGMLLLWLTGMLVK